jgi:hypothetical protein
MELVMTNLKLILIALSLTSLMITAAFGQRPRTINDDPAAPAKPGTTTTAPAPSTVKAKYEGGIFGYPNKMSGTLSLDDSNKRLVFRDGKQKERMSIPYNSITGAYGDTHSVRPAAATVASAVPLYGIPAGFIKTKVRYLTLQFNDPDSNAAGITSFKLENEAILASVLNALATNAGLTKRGDVFIKKKP